MRVSAAFAAVVEYGLALGVRNLRDLPGLWEQAVNDEWWIAVNPHEETLESSHGPKVQFGNCYIEFNGWPAGFITPNGGIIAAGALANEDNFITALKAATEKVKAA